MFREYVRSNAFRLDLSQRQVDMLISIRHYCRYGKVRPWMAESHRSTLGALHGKGLIEWGSDAPPQLTPAGLVVGQLLDLAGYSESN